MKILIVDDVEMNCRLLEDVLKFKGHDAISAANGAEALKKLQAQDFGLIISDIMMPVMDGYEFCRECKQDERLKDIPFIFYTATYKDEQDKRLALELGADGFIIKPTEPKTFLKIVDDVIRDSKKPKIPSKKPTGEREKNTFKLYSERLVNKLEKKMLALEKEVVQRKKAEHDLKERFKELNCLYSLSQLVANTKYSVDEVLGEAIELIPPGWQYPEITCARIILGDKEFKTDNFRTSEWKQSAVIDISGSKKGSVEVYYLEERPKSVEGPFLMEERSLLDGIASILSEMLEREQLEAQLIQSQKMEAIGVLASGVAHDFNNLLTAIMGYSQLALVDLGDNEPLRKDIEEIKNAGERAASLTRQLLTFSRQEILQLEILNLNALVANIEKMLQRLISEDIELVTILEPKLKNIKADPGQIEQVIMNFVVNAKDAMPDGGKIIIRTENITIEEEYCKFYPDARAGEFVSLLVEDTGIGIDKEVIQHIFEPFFTTKEAGKGTGLGLSVVYGIVRQHGGWINAYSELRQGTTLRVYLPAISEDVEGKTKEEVSIVQFKGSGERILVVEDEEGIRKFITKVLGDNDYVVFEAANASEALDIFEGEEEKFDLVFSDVVLPDKNGLELAKQLLSINPHLQIVMTSGYIDRKVDWPTTQGFRFLRKPYTIIDLLRIVKETIESAK